MIQFYKYYNTQQKSRTYQRTRTGDIRRGSNMSDDRGNMLHIAVFPWLAFGHMIPFLELSKCIAQRGHKISFISTPRNIKRLPKIPSHLSSNITFVSLPLVHKSNLPQDAEATSDAAPHQVPYLKIAFDGLQNSVSEFLKTSAPDWLIYDFAPHWLPPIASSLGIPCAFFSIFQAFFFTFFGSWKTMLDGEDEPRIKPEDFTVPPRWITFPSKVAFKVHEAKKILRQMEMNESGVGDLFRVGSTTKGCDVIVVRSCNELESDHLLLLSQINDKPVIPVGLLPPSQPTKAGENYDDDNDASWLILEQFLDKQEKGSTVFIAFGSELVLSPEEVTELAFGLESSGLPFIWALKNCHELQLPEGFEERVEGRGFVWTKWAPQLKILGHISVGGFMTHCGFSSVTEAMHFGIPLIMMPFVLDQGLVARVFAEKKVGVEVPRNEDDGSFTRDSVAKSVRLVVSGTEGEMYRENAKKLRDLFAAKELHDQYVDRFVQFLQNHVYHRKTNSN